MPSSGMLGKSNNSMGNMMGQTLDSASLPMPSTNIHPMDHSEDQGTSMIRNHSLTTTTTDFPNTRDDSVYPNTRIKESCDPIHSVSWHGKDVGNGTMTRHLTDMDELKLSNGLQLSAGEWADSPTNISVGDLLSGMSQDLEDNCIDPPIGENCQGFQQIPFSSDSFDAAIAAHISRHQDKQPALASHMSSIWDAEETCDAFLFKTDPVPHEDGPSLSSVTSLESQKQLAGRSSEKLVKQRSPVKESLVGEFAQRGPMDSCMSDAGIGDHLAKDFSGIADVYWPDSLGPLDLDIPSTKYHSQDLILSDSLSGLNRLIASSLDAFQNCSFFWV